MKTSSVPLPERRPFPLRPVVQRGVTGQQIGTHDTGLWDWEDKVQIGRKLGTGLNAKAAARMADQRPGAEVIIRTSGRPPHPFRPEDLKQNPLESYDVYDVSVVNSNGSPIPGKPDAIALTKLQVIEHMEFTGEVVNKLEDQNGIIPANVTLATSDNQFIDIPFVGGNAYANNFYKPLP